MQQKFQECRNNRSGIVTLAGMTGSDSYKHREDNKQQVSTMPRCNAMRNSRSTHRILKLFLMPAYTVRQHIRFLVS